MDMENKIEHDEADEPDSLTGEDWEVLNKRNLTPTDFKDILTGVDKQNFADRGIHATEIGFKLIFGGLLVLSGIMISIITAISVIGIFIGVLFVAAGLWIAAGSGRETRQKV